MIVQPSFWRLLSVCFRYVKKRGCGTGFGELAPADLSQYFQALSFAGGGTWSSDSARRPPSSPPPPLCQGGWCTIAWSANGSCRGGDHLGWQSETRVGKGEQHPDGKNNPVLLTAIAWPLGPHLWEGIVGLNCTTRIGGISTLRDNHLEMCTCVQGYLWQYEVWNQEQWDDTVPWLRATTTGDGAKLSSGWIYILERTFFCCKS